MSSFYCRVLGILALTSTTCLSLAFAQNPAEKKAGKSACAQYRETERCDALLSEFYSDHFLQKPAPVSSPLDQPMTDNQAFVDRLAGKAISNQLSSGLKAEARQA